MESYIMNQVIKNVQPNISFSWLQIIDKIIGSYKTPFDGGSSIEARIYALRKGGSDFVEQLNNLIFNGYLIPIKDESKYILSKKGIIARKFNSLNDFDLIMNNIIPSTISFDVKKFDKAILAFLNKQPQNFGNISDIVNKFIAGQQENVIKIHKELIYLSRDRDILEIKDLPDNPTEMQSDWWGNIYTVLIDRGQKVEDLKAKLSNGYLKLKWIEKGKNYLWWEVGKILLTAVLAFIVGRFTKSNTCPPDKISQKSESTKKVKIMGQKLNGDITLYDSLDHKKDILNSLKRSSSSTK